MGQRDSGGRPGVKPFNGQDLAGGGTVPRQAGQRDTRPRDHEAPDFTAGRAGAATYWRYCHFWHGGRGGRGDHERAGFHPRRETMTPLAHAITKQLLLPKRERTILDECGLLAQMQDIHCFETSAVMDAARQLVIDGRGQYIGRAMAEVTGFLPAPRTWIEWKTTGDSADPAMLGAPRAAVPVNRLAAVDRIALGQNVVGIAGNEPTALSCHAVPLNQISV